MVNISNYRLKSINISDDMVKVNCHVSFKNMANPVKKKSIMSNHLRTHSYHIEVLLTLELTFPCAAHYTGGASDSVDKNSDQREISPSYTGY